MSPAVTAAARKTPAIPPYGLIHHQRHQTHPVFFPQSNDTGVRGGILSCACSAEQTPNKVHARDRQATNKDNTEDNLPGA